MSFFPDLGSSFLSLFSKREKDLLSLSHLVRREPRERGRAVVHQAQHQAQVGPIRARHGGLRVEGDLPGDVVVEHRAARRPVLLRPRRRRSRRRSRSGRGGPRGALAADFFFRAGEGGFAGGELALSGIEGCPGGGEGALFFGDFLFNRFEHEKKKSSESAPLFSSFPLAGSARAACRDEDTERGRTAGNFKLTSLSATLMTGGGAAEPEEAPQALPPPLSSLPPPPVLVRAAPDGAPPPLPHAEAPFPAITELGVFFTRERGSQGRGFFERRFFFFVGVARADGKRKKATTLSLARASARFPPLLFVLSLALVTRDSPAARSSSWDSKIFRKRRTKEKENGEERGKVSVANAWESIELFAFSFSFFPSRKQRTNLVKASACKGVVAGHLSAKRESAEC